MRAAAAQDGAHHPAPSKLRPSSVFGIESWDSWARPWHRGRQVAPEFGTAAAVGTALNHYWDMLLRPAPNTLDGRRGGDTFSTHFDAGIYPDPKNWRGRKGVRLIGVKNNVIFSISHLTSFGESKVGGGRCPHPLKVKLNMYS